ncbi:hypothetical protein BC939DRAFT_473120 [Gamsiella multidivaricata]|uniref:uncharacterized protein n=1 Tax=Gamsiella multidivaricata TaxID=101098 RepID=UPI0022211E3A|nr:uncharacterized protein BC939DRAFT_473120 [Gamsiella multidivaricata]KAG0363922.1 hypothetical protein BGZ54_007970 [Gamsiella multidivaricata]KAI7831564.1 hypothetical protein BC939DRAFT_473120 [Gamsiella multidivaricata]
MKKSHLSFARVIMLVCISFMALALIHIHYISVFRHAREHPNSNDIDTETLISKEHELPPSYESDSAPQSTPPPAPSTTETNLTTTTHYSNGTIKTEFKPAFYKDPSAARKEIGSFMDTLAKRTWWDHKNTQNPKEVVAPPPTNVFFAYLPMGGGNNQFTSLQKAAILAKDLKRTLLIPPISPNSHIKVWSGPRYSEFYDLEAFSVKSGIPVLEWHDIKHTPENPPSEFTHNWPSFSEEFPCIPNGGIGVNDKNLYDHFRTQFLMDFKATVPASDKTMGKSGDFIHARDVLLKDANPDKPEMWKCLSCPYFLGSEELNDRAWHEVGLHLKFNDKIETMVDEILDLLLPPVKEDSGRRHPEFIIIHLRRGDIVNKCKPGQDEKECLVQIEEIAEKVDEIEKQRRIKALESVNDTNAEVVLERLPVLVATNEKRPKELEKLEKLGWIMLDHGDSVKDTEGNEVSSKTKKLGTMTTLGPFYPPMLDAVLLTRGDYLIGMSNSRMSRLATQRGSAWYRHKVMLM